jgi:large subunit ribosomal protein L19
MSIKPLMAKVEATSLKSGDDKPKFDIGDTVEVQLRILDGDKERIQIFSGIVISKRGSGTSEMFTVRRIVDGEGVERIFPYNSPRIAAVEVKRRAVVRRAKLYFLRDRVGKKAFTLKERPVHKETVGRKRTRVKARKEKQAAAATAETTKKAPSVRKPRQRKKKEDETQKT